jgi:GT2 family glycosyltransferase
VEIKNAIFNAEKYGMKTTICFVPREVFSQTRKSLETLYERTQEPFDLVCVDGNSPPQVAKYLEEAAEKYGFTLLRSDCYLTPNQARNLAANHAWQHFDSPWVVFVDNDVLVSDGWLTALVSCAVETDAWLVGPAYFEHLPERSQLHLFGGECRIETDSLGRRHYREKHHHQHMKLSDVPEPLERHQTELIEFHTVLVRREVYQQLGQLDEGLFCHAEHGDICLSVLHAGQTIWMEPKSQITYVPPKQLDPADRDYFFLRWSDAWFTANEKRFSEKWNLTSPEARHRGLTWTRQHRRYGLSILSSMRKVFGRKLTRSIEKRLVAPLEQLANRRKYPLGEFCQLPEPNIQLIHKPIEQRRAA